MADVRTQQARELATLRLEKLREGCPTLTDRVAEDVLYLADLVAVLETALRYELWVNHGCGFAALYGDDGEMSCGRCGWDFKRSDVLDTIEYVKGARLKRAAALAAAQESPAVKLADTIRTGTHSGYWPPQEPPAAPCYVCGHPVAEGEGWRRDSKTWCPDHRPVWSHD